MKKNVLSKELSKRLGRYGAAALAAASVGSVANGQIVYTADVNDTIMLGDTLALDFNGDEIADVNFSMVYNPRNIDSTWGDFIWTKGAPVSGNKVIASFIYQGSYIKNLAMGDTISANADSLKVQADVSPKYIHPDTDFHGGASLLAHVGFTTWGIYGAGWGAMDQMDAEQDTALVGYEFQIDGAPYYGWVKLTSYRQPDWTAYRDYDTYLIIKEYAYESTEFSIIAGDTATSNVGVDEKIMSALKLDVYPNPTTDILTIKLGQADQYKVSVVDITGKQVVSDEFYGKMMNLSLGDLTSGIYFVRVSNKLQSFSQKVVVK